MDFFNFFRIYAGSNKAWLVHFAGVPRVVTDSGLLFFKNIYREKSVVGKAHFLAVLFTHEAYSHLLLMEYSKPIKDSASLVRRTVPEGGTVSLYRYHEQPAAVFYFERKVNYLETVAEFENRAVDEKNFYCFVRPQDLNDLKLSAQKLKMTVLEGPGGIVLISRLS